MTVCSGSLTGFDDVRTVVLRGTLGRLSFLSQALNIVRVDQEPERGADGWQYLVANQPVDVLGTDAEGDAGLPDSDQALYLCLDRHRSDLSFAFQIRYVSSITEIV